MRLPLKSFEHSFYIAVLSAVVLLSASCRHETLVLREQAAPIPEKDRIVSTFDAQYDPSSASLVFFNRNWTQSEEKVNRTGMGYVSQGTYGSPCTDFWMEYSLWNAKPRRHLMVLAIPPLMVYPVIDTVFLAGCMVCDCCIFPFVWLERQNSSEPLILPESQSAQDKKIISELRIDRYLIYREFEEKHTEKRLVSTPVEVNDSGVRKTFMTDSRGSIKVSRMIPCLFPIRNIGFNPANNTSSKNVQFSTYHFLTPEQQKLWSDIRQKDTAVKQKLEAWEKLRPLSEPKYYERVKNNIQHNFF